MPASPERIEHHDKPLVTPSPAEDWQVRAARDAQDVGKTATAAARGPQDWTVAYYLGADKANIDPPGSVSTADSRTGDLGGPAKAQELQRLAAETKGKSVDAFVDVLRETDQSRADRIRRGATEPSGKPEDYMVDHFRLHDGKVETLGSDKSQGMAADVEHLLHSAGSEPSSKLGLVINGDGGGNRGQRSDRSQLTSNADLEASIQRGLNGSGHQRLDILNFDECLMSQAGALNTFKDATADIVASSETERAAGGRVDGQNLGAQFHDLLQHPEMSGRQWGDRIVAAADAGKNDTPVVPGEQRDGTDTGTATLANIDTSKVGALTTAVDVLGKTLAETISTPSNKEEVDRIISGLSRLGADGPASEAAIYQKRDLQQFTGALRTSVDAGEISDPDGKLRTALDAVSRAEADAVTSYHGDQHGGYDKQGGVSVYLPDSQFRDVDKTLAQQTKLADAGQMLENLDRFSRDPRFAAQDPTKEALAGGVLNNVHLWEKGQHPDKGQEELAKPLTSALDRLRNDQTAEDRQRDVDAALKAVRDLLKSPLQRQMVAALDHTRAARVQTESRDLELRSDSSGWASFVRGLGWQSS